MKKFTVADGNWIYLKAIVFNIIIQLVFSVVASIVLVAVGGDTEIPMLANLLCMILLQGAFFAAVITTVKREKVSLPYKIGRTSVKNLLFAALAALVTVVCFSWLGEWFSIFLVKIGYKLQDMSFNGALEIALAVLVTVVLAPIFEETVFRNALLGGLITKFSKITAVLVSGLAFSLMHMNPEQTVYQFCLGCVCALIAVESGDIIAAMVVHSVNNAIAIVLSLTDPAFLYSKQGNISLLLDNPLLGVLFTLVMSAVGVTLIWLILKAVKRRGDSGESEGEAEVGSRGVIYSVVTPKMSFIIAMGICAVMWITALLGGLIL